MNDDSNEPQQFGVEYKSWGELFAAKLKEEIEQKVIAANFKDAIQEQFLKDTGLPAHIFATSPEATCPSPNHPGPMEMIKKLQQNIMNGMGLPPEFLMLPEPTTAKEIFNGCNCPLCSIKKGSGLKAFLENYQQQRQDLHRQKIERIKIFDDMTARGLKLDMIEYRFVIP